MPFTSETARQYGGARPGAGRPTVGEALIKRTAEQIARKLIEKHLRPIIKNYVKRASGWTETRYTPEGKEYVIDAYDSAITRHAVDKIIPNEQITSAISVPITFQFVSFSSNQNTLQLPAEGLPGTVLAGDDPRKEETRPPDLAQAFRKRQNLPEFSSFSNVPRK